MEKVYKENEGKPENEGNLENEGKPKIEVDPEDDDEMPHIKRNPEHRKRQVEGQAGGEGQSGEGKQGKQGKPKDEGTRCSEGEADFQGKSESESRAAEKHPAEDHVPRKAKRKSDRGTEDSPRDCQENVQERHLGSEEMRECGELSRAQEVLRKKQKVSGFHWMQRDVQDSFASRGQQSVRGVRGRGKGQKDVEDLPYI